MKIIVFDPLYSSVGHFYRYHAFLVGLLARIDAVTEIEVYCTNTELHSLINVSDKVKVSDLAVDIDSIQVATMKAGNLKKVQIAWASYKLYQEVIEKINRSEADLILFPSQGLVSFWLAVRQLKIPYAVSLISIKWIYEKNGSKFPLYKLFSAFIKKAALNIFIEPFYKEITDSHVRSIGIVMPDRYLFEKQDNARECKGDGLQLTTLGTISRIKSPVAFLKEFIGLPMAISKSFRYQIHGKIMDNSLVCEMDALLGQAENVHFTNDYISRASYEDALGATDFAVIPYSAAYTKYSTSGVMWDCFERRVAIICPDIEPFRYYINKYKIGYLYEEGKLASVLERVLEEKEHFFGSLHHHYSLMEKNHTEVKYVEVMKMAIDGGVLNDNGFE